MRPRFKTILVVLVLAALAIVPVVAVAFSPSPPTLSVTPGNQPVIARLEWSASDTASRYAISLATTRTGPFRVVGETDAQTLSYDFLDGIGGVPYYFRVTAINEEGERSAPAPEPTGPVTAAWVSDPHQLANKTTSKCECCHVPHEALAAPLMRTEIATDAPGQLATCLTCHDGKIASAANVAGGARDSFMLASGHTLDTSASAGGLTSRCASCHDPHASSATNPMMPQPIINDRSVSSTGNAWCLSCHDDDNSWYPSTYPSSSAPHTDTAGYPVLGTWLGQTTYNGAGNAHRLVPATSQPTGSGKVVLRGAGDCLYCHAAHRGSNTYDGLVAAYRPTTTSTLVADKTQGDYAALCLACHGGTTPSGFATAPVDIKRHVTSGGQTAGHSIVTSGGLLPVGSPLPCYECHNPHGSNRDNDSMISDVRGASLTTTGSADVVRHFCFTCHTTPISVKGWNSATETYVSPPAGDNVVGIPRTGGVLNLPDIYGHRESDTSSCYSCHGSSYAAGGENVHSPGMTFEALHATTVNPSCTGSNCHTGTSLTSIHLGTGSTLTCDTCHSSTDPTVVSAIANHDKDCTTCHGATSHGNVGSHRIHTNAADPRGPGGLVCGDCHDTNAMPLFKDGQDLGNTHSCDECHSPGGSYNGVVSTSGSVGAKTIWDEGAYENTSTLKPGKDKWCAGCHDGDPSVAGQEPSLVRGVYAPPIAGNEGASTPYGAGYGYYKTGHGVPATQTIPSNGSDAGPGLSCDACHDFTEAHVDGLDRTHDTSGTPTTYRQGYRLDLVDGAEPMKVPRTLPGGPPTNRDVVDDARLCYKCHDSAAFTSADSPPDTSIHLTNFWIDSPVQAFESSYYFNNLHAGHMWHISSGRWSSDWSATLDSRISCPTCHNVHGSKYLAMTRDGELESDVVERRPGLRLWYKNSAVTTFNPIGSAPSPENVTLAMSDGWIWNKASGDTICLDCHGGILASFDRTLWRSYPTTPVLSWTGESGYVDDGANPQSGPGSPGFTFRIKYSDANNDAPAWVRLRIDRNDDGDFSDADETVAMEADSPTDASYFDGALFHVDPLVLLKAGDNVLDYYFEASDGTLAGTGPGTRTVTLTNAAPTLPWTGESGYTLDGVNPESGEMDATNFEFRVTYRDTDGEEPEGGVKLHIDKNDDGDYDEVDELVTMSDMGDLSYILGKRYSYSTTLGFAGDGALNYYFEATDGTDAALSAVRVVTVTSEINHTPSLAWTAESATYDNDGADPDYQAARKPFDFRVKYTDSDNDAPLTGQVWIDFDDDGDYLDAGEMIAMDDPVATPPNDGSYLDGEIFAERVNVPYAGDGTIKYCFHFTDAHGAEATGQQSVEKTIQVFDAIDVRTSGGDFSTIQAAVDSAGTVDGMTILVDDGTWASFAYKGKNLTVESVNGAAYSTISGSGYVVDFNLFGTGSDSALKGFTVTGGTRGIQSNGSDVTVQDCVIEGNAIGVYHQGAAADPIVIERCTIRDNTSYGFQALNSAAIVTLRDDTLSGNTGGIACNGGSDFRIERCSVVNNNAGAANGAGIYISGATCTMRISDSLIATNTTTGNGGGFYGQPTSLTVDRTTFRGNTAGGAAGGIYAFGGGSVMTFNDCFVDGNTAGTNGGGLYYNSGNITVNRTYIRGNTSNNTANGGGGLYTSGTGTWAFNSCTFSGNYANFNGGGAYLTNLGTTLLNCTFSGNSANLGGGIYGTPNANGALKAWNCILYGDDSRIGAIEEIDGTNIARFEVRYTDINQSFTSFYNQSGNMTSNPLFITPVAPGSATEAGDCHLQLGTPCDGGADESIAPGTDIDGDTRIHLADEMGSDEL